MNFITGTYAGIPTELLVVVLIWSLIWKGLALWKSARLNNKIWFIALLVINTLGILEILYLFLFSKIDLSRYKNSSRTKSKKSKPRKK